MTEWTFPEIMAWVLILFIFAVCAFILCPWPGKGGK